MQEIFVASVYLLRLFLRPVINLILKESTMQNTKYTPIPMPRDSKYGSDYFIVKSYKLGRVIKLYSNLEFKNWLTLESDPQVITFCEQPYKAEMLYHGQRKESIFDMWVKYKDNSEEFQEVKYSQELINKDKHAIRSQEQIEFQTEWCRMNNVRYQIRTEGEIECGPNHIENLLHISSRIKHYNHVQAKQFYNDIQDALLIGPMSIFELSIKLHQSVGIEDFLSIIAFAIYDGIVAINIENDYFGLMRR